MHDKLAGVLSPSEFQTHLINGLTALRSRCFGSNHCNPAPDLASIDGSTENRQDNAELLSDFQLSPMSARSLRRGYVVGHSCNK
jgi:hypothetical protein